NIGQETPSAQTGLITAGPYRFIRHPIYAGLLLLKFGMFLAFGSLLAALVAIPPSLILAIWLANYEENFLISKYGGEAADYRLTVPLLLPNFSKSYPIRRGILSWKQGLKHDIGP